MTGKRHFIIDGADAQEAKAAALAISSSIPFGDGSSKRIVKIFIVGNDGQETLEDTIEINREVTQS